MNNNFYPIKYDKNLQLLDQRKLPHNEEYVICENLEDGFNAIRDMVVRGAPCIGFTAIYTLALWIKNNPDFSVSDFKNACEKLKQARPTAVNLQFEVDRVFDLVSNLSNQSKAYEIVKEFGDTQIQKSEIENRSMAKTAQKELDKKLGLDRYRILTHCNTGFLACGSIGTALGVIQQLHEDNKLAKAWVDETRPYLQGSRLTAYELQKIGAPFDIVVEGAASYLMSNGLVDAIFTGADRIAANGDTANKVGTSNLAIIAKHYNVPFYIVAPSSSFDLSLKSGLEIEVELRDSNEILSLKDSLIAPKGATAYNPSFDITSGEIITGIINENGIASGNYLNELKEIVRVS